MNRGKKPRENSTENSTAHVIHQETSRPGHMLYIFKLERQEGKRRIVHSTPLGVTKQTFPASRDENGRLVPGREAREWAEGFPGWEAAFL